MKTAPRFSIARAVVTVMAAVRATAGDTVMAEANGQAPLPALTWTQVKCLFLPKADTEAEKATEADAGMVPETEQETVGTARKTELAPGQRQEHVSIAEKLNRKP